MLKEFIEKLFWRFYEADTKAEDFSIKEREEVFKTLEENDEFRELLRAILKGDKDRYFRASNEKSRNIIRGEYIRTQYFLRKILRPKVEKQANRKIGRRYG